MSIKGQLSVSVKGDTIFNYANNGVDYANWTVQGAGSTKGASGIHLVQATNSEGAFLNLNLKPNTQYTFVYYVKVCTLSSTLVGVDSSVFGVNITLPKTVGLNKYVFTTPVTITNNRLYLACQVANVDGEYIDFELYSILEGDWTARNEVNKSFGYGVKGTLSIGNTLRTVNL
jgi:hypothetical protein